MFSLYIYDIGPFYCARGVFGLSLTTCAVTPSLISVATLVTLTETDAMLGYIDPIFNLQDSKVLSGTKDIVIVQG